MSDQPQAAPDPGEALYHDTTRAPGVYHLLFLLPLLVAIASALVTAAPLLIPLASSLPLVLIWLLFSTLRIRVDRRELHVQFGLLGPRIPIGSIQECEAIAHDWKDLGGWGLRHGPDGSVAYNMLGDPGRAVRVTWRRGKKPKTVLLSSRDPERLATAINQARVVALSGDAVASPAEEQAPAMAEVAAPDEAR